MDEKANGSEVKEENTVERNDGAGTTDTRTVDNQSEGTSKEIEQENQETLEEKAQRLADGMLKKKMKNMPSKEELKAFKDWKEAQKTDEEKRAEKDAEYQSMKNEIKMLKNEKIIMQSGVSSEYADYVNYELSKMEGDFEENLEEFIKNNPQYVKKAEQKEENSSSTGAPVKQTTEPKISGVKAILQQKHPELYKN